MIAFFMKHGGVTVRSAYLSDEHYGFPPRSDVREIWVDGDDLKGYPGLLCRKGEGGIVKVGPQGFTSIEDFYNAKFHYPEDILHQFGDPK